MNRQAKQIGHWALLLILAGPVAGCSLLARPVATEYPNAQIPASKFTSLAVLPADPRSHDPQIAARARQNLRADGIEIVEANASAKETVAAMLELCPKDKPARFAGVVFVTWNHLQLLDCATHEVAYSIDGRYSGIDEMTKRLARYLKGNLSS
jgi:hypothetical protein